MCYWLIRVYKPSEEKGVIDKLVLALNFSELDDLLELIDSLREDIIKFRYKISISVKKVSFDVSL